MHAYRRFVQTEMDKRGWTAADLQRSSGLTKQNLSRLLRDDREQLQQRPDTGTVTALARAFGIDEALVLTHVAEAMGLPTSRVEVAAAADLSNEELLRILAERLNRGGTDEPARRMDANLATPSGDDVEDPTERNGATSRPDVGDHRGWKHAREAAFAAADDTNQDGSEAGEIAHPLHRGSSNDDRPWEQDEYGLAAKRGRNRGREAREQQDRDAEGGGA